MAVKKKNVSLKMGKHKSRTGGLTAAGRKKYNRLPALTSRLHSPEEVHAKDHSVQECLV